MDVYGKRDKCGGTKGYAAMAEHVRSVDSSARHPDRGPPVGTKMHCLGPAVLRPEIQDLPGHIDQLELVSPVVVEVHKQNSVHLSNRFLAA